MCGYRRAGATSHDAPAAARIRPPNTPLAPQPPSPRLLPHPVASARPVREEAQVAAPAEQGGGVARLQLAVQGGDVAAHGRRGQPHPACSLRRRTAVVEVAQGAVLLLGDAEQAGHRAGTGQVVQEEQGGQTGRGGEVPDLDVTGGEGDSRAEAGVVAQDGEQLPPALGGDDLPGAPVGRCRVGWPAGECRW